MEDSGTSSSGSDIGESSESNMSNSGEMSGSNTGSGHNEEAIAEEESMLSVYFPYVDPAQYCSSSGITFNAKSYDLMLASLSSGIVPPVLEIQTITNACTDRRRWKETMDSLKIIPGDDGSRRLCLREKNQLLVSYLEEWPEIVIRNHITSDGHHLSIDETKQAIKNRWCLDMRKHGLSSSYVRDCINGCICRKKNSNKNSMCLGLQTRQRQVFNFTLVLDKGHVQSKMDELSIKYQVHLIVHRTTQHFTDHRCHRGLQPRRSSDRPKQRSTKKCGCPFLIRVSTPKENKVLISVYDEHKGHQPGSRADLYHLQVHSSVIDCCTRDLYDVGSVRHVTRMSMAKEGILKKAASTLDQVIFHFFMIRKEISRLSFNLRIGDKMHLNDWESMSIEAEMLQLQGKVLYHQPYNPEAEDRNKRPFILVLQDNFMFEMAKRFSRNNSWAVDSTFKTNKYGLPLYAAVTPNNKGIGVPLWIMLCSKDSGELHESIALEITFSMLLSRLGEIRPAAIVIDKSQTEFQAIQRVVQQDACSWQTVGNHKEQVACHVLLCHFHVKKAWVENLLPKVPEEFRDEVYGSMCGMMYASTQHDFEIRFEDFSRKYGRFAGVLSYVTNGWCGENSPWKGRWNRYGRLFPHGEVETTNLVERLWQYVKYTLLEGQVNRNIHELLVALVGDARTGTRMGGTLLEFYKQKQEIADSERFSTCGNTPAQTTRLHGAARILSRYKSDPSTLVVINGASLLFQIQSEKSEEKWYQISLQSLYCSCLDNASACKHILGLRMIVEQCMPSLHHLMPVIDTMHTMPKEGYVNNCLTEEDDALFDNDYNLEPPEQSREKNMFEKAKIVISNIKEALSSFEKRVVECSTFTIDDYERLLQVNKILTQDPKPMEIKLPLKGSIAHLQENVKATRLGHGAYHKQQRLSCGDGSVTKESTMVIPKHSGQRRAHQKSRTRVRLDNRSRYLCSFCEVKTLVFDIKEDLSCKNCHAMLPLPNRFVSKESFSFLIGRRLEVVMDSQVIVGTIIGLSGMDSSVSERELVVRSDLGDTISGLKASLVRMTLQC